MKRKTDRSPRMSSLWLTLFVVTAASVACNSSTPTEPMTGPGPVGPIGAQDSGIDGSGVYVEEDRPVAGFDGIRLLSVASVFVEQGAGEQVTVRAEDNVISHIQTEVVGGVLEITTESGVSFENVGPIQVLVTARNLIRLELDGVGEIHAMALGFEALQLALSGTGNLRLSDVDGDRIEARMDGVGAVSIGGRVTEQVVEVFGVGDYKAKKLHSTRANVRVHSLGSATVRVSQHLAATVRGSGSVYYYGNPVVESSVTGSGQVVQVGG